MPRKKGDGSFKKLPNGTFQFSVSVGYDLYGKRIRKTFYGKTESACRKQYQDYIKGGEKTASSSEYTLYAWIDVWLNTYKKGNVSEGTYEDYTNLAAHIKNHKIGEIKLSQVKPIHITGFFGEKMSYSHSFRKRMKFLLTSSFECAIDNDLCTKNPVRRAEIAKKAVPEKEAFTENDVSRILKFAETDKYFGLAIYIMFQTGIRSGEMRALKADKIDLDKGMILIDTAVKRNGKLGLPKNNKPRTIPLKPEVVSYLSDKINAKSIYIIGGNDYVSKEGFRSRYLCFFERLNKSLVNAGEKPIVPKSPHATRHTFGTLYHKNGMPMAIVSALMGHQSTDVTDKYVNVGDVTTLAEAMRDYKLLAN